MKRYSTLLIVSMLLYIACTSSSNSDVSQSVETVSPLPLINSLSVPHGIQTGDFHKLNVIDDWGNYGRMASITCDSLCVYIPDCGENDWHGRSAYSWDGNRIWALEDSVINKTYIDGLDSTHTSDKVIVESTWDNLLFVNRESGTLVHIIPASAGSGIDATKINFSRPHSLCNKYLLAWHPIAIYRDRIALSVTDESLNCLWELAVTEEDESFPLVKTTSDGDTAFLYSLPFFPKLGSFHATCDDSSFYICPSWMDVLMELDIDGNLLTVFEGHHQTLSESERLLQRGGNLYYLRESVSQIQYLGNDIMAILYGPVNFACDSSEIWCINLKTGGYGILPFAKSVTAFAATEDNLVVSLCTFFQDSTSGLWSAVDGEIAATSWDLAPISSLHQ